MAATATPITSPPTGRSRPPGTAYRRASGPQLWYYAAVSPPENEELLAGWSAPNLRRDVSRHITRKLQAIACHRSQALSTVDFIRKFPERITQETFYVVGD